MNEEQFLLKLTEFQLYEYHRLMKALMKYNVPKEQCKELLMKAFIKFHGLKDDEQT